MNYSAENLAEKLANKVYGDGGYSTIFREEWIEFDDLIAEVSGEIVNRNDHNEVHYYYPQLTIVTLCYKDDYGTTVELGPEYIQEIEDFIEKL